MPGLPPQGFPVAPKSPTDQLRDAGGLLDFLAAIGVETANLVPRGLAGFHEVATGAMHHVGRAAPFIPTPTRPGMDPTVHDVAGMMARAPQIPNPFPISQRGQEMAVSLSDAIGTALQSDFVQGALDLESRGEQRLNELLGPQVPGMTLAMAQGVAETFGRGPRAAIVRKSELQRKKGLTEQEKHKLKNIEKQYPGIRPLLPYLTNQERRILSTTRAKEMLTVWDELDPGEMASVALAGRAKKGWYDRSGKAIFEIFGEEDAPRFIALLAAMSPRTSVESNLRNALNTWINWDKAGRPRDSESIFKIMAQSVEGHRGEKSVLGAWIPNSVGALAADDILEFMASGPKVDSFMRNLFGDMTRLTNDTWIAKYTGILDPDILQQLGKARRKAPFTGSPTIGQPGFEGPYLAVSAASRKAAELLSRRTGEKWLPAEVQETVWSWSKTLWEKADKTNTPITELINDLTNVEVLETPDFGTLLSQPNHFRAILERGDFDAGLGRLDEFVRRNRGETVLPTGTSASAAGIQSRHLDAAARRLEEQRRAARRPGAIEKLRESVDRVVAGNSPRVFGRRASGNRRGNVAASYTLPADRVRVLNSLGVSTPLVNELQPSARAISKFHKSIMQAKKSHPAGAQVYVYTPEEYANMRLFMTEDGKAGFALNGDDIVSVFNHRKSNYQRVTTELIMLAVEQGGRRLDAFDTYLPHIYGQLGFRTVRREPWNEQYKPEDWSKDYFKKYNGGEPDVVFMEYSPTARIAKMMAERADPLKPQQLVPQQAIEADLSRFDERLRSTVR